MANCDCFKVALASPSGCGHSAIAVETAVRGMVGIGIDVVSSPADAVTGRQGEHLDAHGAITFGVLSGKGTTARVFPQLRHR
ncbi:hypothetical protein ACIQVL_19475 [Streptomyces sp. NPDC090499]|uniref:hypothetical protein n=1 Tax=unclassified Streptomyces TaxID=2593676 RepID=UPI003802E7AA